MFERPHFTAVYYSHTTSVNEDIPLVSHCLEVMRKAVKETGGEFVAVTWKPVANADRNIVVEGLTKGHLTQYHQIGLGLNAARSDVVCLCERDILYPASHFLLMAERSRRHRDMVHYNFNVRHLSREGYFLPDRANTFFSAAAADRGHMRQAIAAKVAEAQASPKQKPAWCEPRPDDWPIMFHNGPDPVIDFRWGGNWTGPRAPGDDSLVKEIFPWGHVRNYEHLFM